MITAYEVYKTFKQAEAEFKGKEYKEKKSFTGTWDRLTKENKEIILTLSNYFNTKWYNINPKNYFLAGFKIWKGFNWSKALDEKVIKKYISRDKAKKKKVNDSVENVKEDFIYIKEYGINEYCELMDGNVKVACIDYARGKITGTTLYWLISNFYLEIGEQDEPYITYIKSNEEEYEELTKEMKISKLISDLDKAKT